MNEEKQTSAAEEVKPATLKKLPDFQTVREARGLTIEDIFLKTRINPAILTAIENGEFHLLPAPLYAKKFIAIYAESIGADAEIILAHYQRYLDEKQALSEEVKAVKVPIAPDRKPKRYLFYIVPAAAIIAVAFIIYTFHEQGPPRVVQHNVAVSEQKKVVPTPAPAVKERPGEAVDNALQTPAVTPKETTKPQQPAVIPKDAIKPPSNAPVDLLIEATEETWLSIKADNKPPYQITLKKGEKLSRKAREFFIVDVGNARGVNITFQGKSLGNLGQEGRVVHLRLSQQ